mmetsp:Transcript_38277/g.36630  ORF Transcript_38277/g.36630 Transcript_38277/m.36630 type:complete len:94 (-) Transcript_38277:1325-1606(-)
MEQSNNLEVNLYLKDDLSSLEDKRMNIAFTYNKNTLASKNLNGGMFTTKPHNRYSMFSSIDKSNKEDMVHEYYNQVLSKKKHMTQSKNSVYSP